jgi:ribosome maturation factor RimP
LLILVTDFALKRAIFVYTDMKNLKIQEICEQVVQSEGFFFIDLTIRGQRDRKVIEVFIDAPGDLSVNDCAAVSRKIGDALEAQELLDDVSRLDVSSPGVDRPLKFLLQYPKHIGRILEIQYAEEGKPVEMVQGRLQDVTGELLLLTKKDRSQLVVNFSSIKTAIVRISFT